MLETGEIGRFASGGDFASYVGVWIARESQRQSKGGGNTKYGNKYLAWAFVEAPISRCGTTRRSRASTSVRRRKPAWWRSRRWPTSWAGPVITFYGIQVPFEVTKAFA